MLWNSSASCLLRFWSMSWTGNPEWRAPWLWTSSTSRQLKRLIEEMYVFQKRQVLKFFVLLRSSSKTEQKLYNSLKFIAFVRVNSKCKEIRCETQMCHDNFFASLWYFSLLFHWKNSKQKGDSTKRIQCKFHSMKIASQVYRGELK